jgi:GT2 family glycosyltransferase
MYDVNIVIVNYKMKAHIEKCFASLFLDFQTSPLNVHVVVVDNASGDGIEEFLQVNYPNVECLVLPENVGFGAATNHGIRAAGAKYHFILNPDTYFFPGTQTIKKLYDFMEARPEVGMIGPKILYPDGSLQYSCYRFPTFWQPLYSRTRLGQKGEGKIVNDYALMKDFSHDRTMPVDWLMGSAMFARGTSLDRVGLFDDLFFMYYEDSDLCRRFWEAHIPVYYVPEVVIAHTHGRGSAKVPGVLRAMIKNKLARIHVQSWLKYMWKWRGNYKYYAG